MGGDKEQNELLAVDIEKGIIIQNFLLDVPLAGDWESMSLGPCTSTETTQCLYIGNMGNNLASSCSNTTCTSGRLLVYIYKLEEPNLDAVYNGTALQVSTLQINYTGSNFPTNRANSESLFVVRRKPYLTFVPAEGRGKHTYLHASVLIYSVGPYR